ELKLDLIFEKLVLNQCDVIIAQSPGVTRYMLDIYGQNLAKKIRLVHTGVDHEKFAPPAKSPPTKQILFVGALSEIKGVTCLLDAFKQVHQGIPQARLVLIGSGPKAPYYKEYVAQNELDGSVAFFGPVRDDDRLLQLYGSSD